MLFSILLPPRFYHCFLLLILKFRGVKILFDYRSGSVGKYRFLFVSLRSFIRFSAPNYIIYLNNFVQNTLWEDYFLVHLKVL